MKREDDLRSSRRSLVLGGLGLAATPWLAACANRPPPPPPKPFSLLAVLPVVATAASGRSTGFAGGRTFVRNPSVVVNPNPVAALVGTAMVVAIDAARQSEHEAMQRALTAVAFDTEAAIQEHLATALAQREVRMVFIKDMAVAAAVRDGQLSDLPAGVDAVLDINLEEAGFDNLRNIGGWTPRLNFWARVIPTAPGAADPDEITYFADWRGSTKDKRWVETPKSMIFPRIEDLERRASDAHAGLDRIVRQLVEVMADDLKRHSQGLPLLA